MIRDFQGEPTTPKRMAQDLLLMAASNAMYHLNDHAGLTARERAAIEEHLDKQFNRMQQFFGYEPGSWSWG